MTQPEPAAFRAALTLLTGRPGGAGTPPQWADARAEAENWVNDRRIRGLGIRRVRGGRMALAVYVDPSGGFVAPIPASLRVPGSGREVPIEVLPLGTPRLQNGLTNAFIKPCGGCAVSIPGQPHGTFGCLVRDPVPGGAMYILTAAHVIAKCGLAQGNEEVFQPKEPRKVGTLSSWGKIAFTGTGFPNLFDAALAVVSPAQVTPSIHAIGRPLGATSQIQDGMPVQKCGATTVHTCSAVLDSNFACRFEYEVAEGEFRAAGFQRQVLCKPFTEDGDSGAAVLNKDRKVVGLVIGGIDGEGSVFSPIGPILTRFGVAVA